MTPAHLTLAAVAALAVAGAVRRSGSRSNGPSLTPQQLQARSPSERVYDELESQGGRFISDGSGVVGPSPIARVILSDQTDWRGRPIIWIHWIKSDGSGKAWRYLSQIIRKVAPEISVAGEALPSVIGFWIHQGAYEIDLREAEDIYPYVDESYKFFTIEP